MEKDLAKGPIKCASRYVLLWGAKRGLMAKVGKSSMSDKAAVSNTRPAEGRVTNYVHCRYGA